MNISTWVSGSRNSKLITHSCVQDWGWQGKDMNVYKKFLKMTLITGWLVITSSGIFPQEERVNNNYYYRYPVSFGVSYQQVILLEEVEDNYDFFLFDVSGNIRSPISFFPYLQPGIKLGLYQIFGWEAVESGEPDHDRYNHSHLYASAGLHITHRFSKTFEAGLFGYGGISYTIYPHLLPEAEDDRAQYNFLAEGGVSLSINPMYNISIEIHPTVRYQSALYGSFHDFDGYNLAVTTAMNFRMGEDPDIKKGLYRSIDFKEISIPAVFAAMQSFYAENPLGYIVITNKDKRDLTEIKISFFQAEYMDSPTPVLTIPLLKHGETREVPLYAVYNSSVLETEGMVPLTGEIILTYNLKDKPGKQTTQVVYNLHDKTALTWDDDKKIAAFVTPADNIIKDYGSYIQQASRDQVLALFNRPLQTAMQVYSALQSMGCLYQEDPVSPFSRMKEDKFVVDSVNLPRETIKRLTGDCDDLTVLFLSLLEARGVETGFITVPGHIYAAFNTGIAVEDYREIHPERIMTINHKGQLWVPVEITALGTEDFIRAWQMGSKEFLEWEFDPGQRKLYVTREAQEIYKPIPLKQQENKLLFVKNSGIANNYAATVNRLSNIIIEEYRTLAAKNQDKKSYNKLGIMYATFNRKAEAEAAFQQALEMDPNYAYAQISLGDLYVKAEEFRQALGIYNVVQADLENRGEVTSGIYTRLLLRISVMYYMLDDTENARAYYARANAIAPDQARRYAYLAATDDKTTRGKEVGVFDLGFPFFEEDE